MIWSQLKPVLLTIDTFVHILLKKLSPQLQSYLNYQDTTDSGNDSLYKNLYVLVLKYH